MSYRDKEIKLAEITESPDRYYRRNGTSFQILSAHLAQYPSD